MLKAIHIVFLLCWATLTQAVTPAEADTVVSNALVAQIYAATNGAPVWNSVVTNGAPAVSFGATTITATNVTVTNLVALGRMSVAEIWGISSNETLIFKNGASATTNMTIASNGVVISPSFGSASVPLKIRGNSASSSITLLISPSFQANNNFWCVAVGPSSASIVSYTKSGDSGLYIPYRLDANPLYLNGYGGSTIGVSTLSITTNFTLDINGNTLVRSNLTVNGSATIRGGLTVQGTNITGLGYVARDYPTSVDIAVGSPSIRTNGTIAAWDISSIVPTNAKIAYFSIQVSSTTAGNQCLLLPSSNLTTYTYVPAKVYVSGISGLGIGGLPVAANRIVYVYCTPSGTYSFVNVAVTGWGF